MIKLVSTKTPTPSTKVRSAERLSIDCANALNSALKSVFSDIETFGKFSLYLENLNSVSYRLTDRGVAEYGFTFYVDFRFNDSEKFNKNNPKPQCIKYVAKIAEGRVTVEELRVTEVFAPTPTDSVIVYNEPVRNEADAKQIALRVRDAIEFILHDTFPR